MLISSGLVLLMVPAVCLLYSGNAESASQQKLFRLPLITTATIGFQVRTLSKPLVLVPEQE
jgi:ammonia channel protein AmtB